MASGESFMAPNENNCPVYRLEEVLGSQKLKSQMSMKRSQLSNYYERQKKSEKIDSNERFLKKLNKLELQALTEKYRIANIMSKPTMEIMIESLQQHSNQSRAKGIPIVFDRLNQFGIGEKEAAIQEKKDERARLAARYV